MYRFRVSCLFNQLVPFTVNHRNEDTVNFLRTGYNLTSFTNNHAYTLVVIVYVVGVEISVGSIYRAIQCNKGGNARVALWALMYRWREISGINALAADCT